MFNFEGKIAVITGAAKGIGFSCAKRMAEAGAVALILDLNREGVDLAVKELSDAGLKAAGYVCNVADRDSVKEACDAVIADFEHVDFLVNSAGITRDAFIHKMDYAQWDAVISVNLTGTFNMSQYLGRFMRARGCGRIVNIASTSAMGNMGQTNYSASKAGVMGFTRSLAKEFGRFNINVNAVLPGVTETDIIKTVPEHLLEQWKGGIPLGRFGKPEEQADVICYLCSEYSSYITGECIVVSGGACMI